MKKRFLSVVLSACLLTGMLPGISISAAETETLQSILDAAEENTTIVLSEDYTESVTVAANKHVTIDLNGHTRLPTRARLPLKTMPARVALQSTELLLRSCCFAQ